MESFATIIGVAVILGGILYGLGYIFKQIKAKKSAKPDPKGGEQK